MPSPDYGFSLQEFHVSCLVRNIPHLSHGRRLILKTIVTLVLAVMFFRLSDSSIRSRNTFIGGIFGIIGIMMIISLIGGFLSFLWKILPVFVIGALIYLLVKKP